MRSETGWDSSLRRSPALVALVVVLSLLLTACGSTSPSASGPAASGSGATTSCSLPYDASVLDPREMPASLDPTNNKPDISKMSTTSKDLGSLPDSKPVWYDTLKLTPEQVNQICGKHLKAVFLDWADALYNQIIRSGQRLTLQAVGINLARVTSFSFNPNGLAGQLASVLPLKPDIIFTGGTIDPNQMAAIMKPALDQGITIISWCVGAKGWETGQGKQMLAMIAYDFYQLGRQMAVAVHNRYPDGATLGWLHWINNIDAIHNREQGFLDGLKDYPNIKIVSDGGPADTKGSNSGYSDPNAAQAYSAAFLLRHPEVNVIFAPWEDPPGLGEESAIKQAGREGKVDIVTMDLGEAGARELATGGAITVDMGQDIWDGGRAMAMVAAMNSIGLETPPFVIFPTFATTKDNLKDSWDFMHGPEIPLPVEVK